MGNVFHVIFSLSQLYPIFAVKMAHLERYFNILFAISFYTSFSANSVQKRANFENEILKTVHNNLEKKEGWLSSETWEKSVGFFKRWRVRLWKRLGHARQTVNRRNIKCKWHFRRTVEEGGGVSFSRKAV